MSYNNITPNFAVKNVKETVLFYRDALGFKLDLLVPTGEKTIVTELEEGKVYDCAMMTRDKVFVMFLEENCMREDTPSFKNASGESVVIFYVDVDNIDELYESLNGKVEVVKDLHSTWYGMKEFYIKDCNGYTLAYGQKIAGSA
jgi:uncharacterized glyoxalase superfamily protein PhnB